MTAGQEGPGAADATPAKTVADSAATSPPAPAPSAGKTGGPGGQESRTSGTTAGTSRCGGATGGTGPGRGSGDGGAGDKTGYGQSCGSNDLRWSATSMTQAGGYNRISVSAKPGITAPAVATIHLPRRVPAMIHGSWIPDFAL
ncbi:hypothetical protein ACIRFH_20405 [Streptomyces sp. NPDC093586]|uniref:hypothetical protein n=1 Tax=Streptomyces sp. NPDC093586 TaxID=3366042 RepID=UPI003826A3B9